LVVLHASEPEIRNSIDSLKVINLNGLLLFNLSGLFTWLGLSSLLGNNECALLLEFLVSSVECWNVLLEVLDLTCNNQFALIVEGLLLSSDLGVELLDLFLKLIRQLRTLV
jgi:hypothetical protein